ncbi:GIY-YIG nuclease family protein [Crocosphaera sp. UHCC 0190]|uniref:GIY-YIG nuclease family protein n=1 Tax=Crocosphaera sp. UHCC 0190 TaxID=3110246 RepID=UPI002B219C86|nr:GIY-YIG nuclease family protein [Crocosphaera sp. UHCC 0190]MEA5508754.1 GIY-YIG nuclease family protein [Crocosphaera sp. UHCC 0190]
MKTLEKELNLLPSVSFDNLDELPEYSGIYFVIDSSDRIIYIGQSENILNRWKNNHHRKPQIEEIHLDYPVKIACKAWNKEDLKTAEKYYINHYHPLLNGTDVKLPKTIPSEVMVRKLLEKIRLLVIIIGIKKAHQNHLPIIYLKYNYENTGKNGCARIIKEFKKEYQTKGTNLKITRTSYGEYTTHNVRPGSREHKVISRIKSSYNNHWTIPCNGVIVDITPVDKAEFYFLRDPDNSSFKKLAEIKIRSVNTTSIVNSFNLGLIPMVDDPIPLLWTGL